MRAGARRRSSCPRPGSETQGNGSSPSPKMSATGPLLTKGRDQPVDEARIVELLDPVQVPQRQWVQLLAIGELGAGHLIHIDYRLWRRIGLQLQRLHDGV